MFLDPISKPKILFNRVLIFINYASLNRVEK